MTRVEMVRRENGEVLDASEFHTIEDAELCASKLLEVLGDEGRQHVKVEITYDCEAGR